MRASVESELDLPVKWQSPAVRRLQSSPAPPGMEVAHCGVSAA